MDYAKLEELLNTILGRGSEGVSVLEALKMLDQYVVDHANQLPKRLQHFLERRSYEKAFNFITGNELNDEIHE